MRMPTQTNSAGRLSKYGSHSTDRRRAAMADSGTGSEVIGAPPSPGPKGAGRIERDRLGDNRRKNLAQPGFLQLTINARREFIQPFVHGDLLGDHLLECLSPLGRDV